MLKYISLPVFIISFILGLIFIQLWGPERKEVLIYPTLDNYSVTQYKDNAKQCFEFTPIQVKCPLQTGNISAIPIQT